LIFSQFKYFSSRHLQEFLPMQQSLAFFTTSLAPLRWKKQLPPTKPPPRFYRVTHP